MDSIFSSQILFPARENYAARGPDHPESSTGQAPNKRDGHLQPLLAALPRGIAVVAVEYRFSGEALFPAAVLDVRQAVRFVKAHAAQYGIDPTRLIAIGGSAGGNLAATLGMNVPNGAFPGECAGACGGVQPDVLAAVDQFGPTDFKAMDAQARANGVSIADHDLPDSPESRYLGICVAKASAALCAQANPLTYAGTRMARLLVQHGTADRLVPYQQSVALVEGLKQKGLGDRVTFTTLEGADHDDARFCTAENLKIVFDFIGRAIVLPKNEP